MTRKLTITAVFVVFMALMMAFSPVAMAAGGTTGAVDDTSQDIGDADLDVEEVQTQTVNEVEIDSTLEREARGGDTVEVLVRMDAQQSSLASTATETTQATLEQEATRTQATLETYAAGTSGVEILNEFWIANAALVEVDTSQMDIRELATVDGVIQLNENFEVTTDSATTPQVSSDLINSDDGEDREGVSTDRASEEAGDYNQTYGLEQINVPEVWEGLNATGDGASVAVLDSGIDADHPEFDDFNAEDNWAEFDSAGERTGEEPFDNDGHGTHVSGTIAGDNASGTSIGVAPDAELHVGSVLPDGSGTAAQVLGGMQWAVEENVDVLSMSLGAAGHRDVYLETIANAHAEGTILVASAGNEEEGTTSSPGNDPLGVSVGASNVDLGIAGFSSGELVDTASAYGYSAGTDWPEQYILPDVSAPGVSILSSYPDGEYEHLQGTSMAAPHVSGVVALMVAENPDLTIDEIKETLVESAEKPPEDIATEPGDEGAELDGQDTRYGHGIVDAYHAVSSVSGDGESVTVSVEDSDGSSVTDVPVEVDGESGVPMSSFTNADGEAEYQLAAGEYTVSATDFGYSEPTETITVDGESDDVTLTLDSNVDAEVLIDQPSVVGSNASSLLVDADVANLQNYTVDVTDSSIDSDAIEGVTLLNTTNQEEITTTELGETVNVADELSVEQYDGFLGVEVETGTLEDADPSLELEHTFNGTGADVTVTTGPSETLDEPESANITLDAALDETIAAGEGVEPSVTITNTGDQTAEVPVYYQIGESALQLDAVTIEGGETYQSAYPITGIQAAVGAGDVTQAIIAGSEREQNTLTIEAAGNVTGTITNAEGEPIEGAEIRLVDTNTFTNIAQPTTDENGEYRIDVGDRAPTSWYMTIEHPQYGMEQVGTPFAGEPSTTDGSTQEIDVEMAAGAQYTVPVEADEPTPIGFPGDTEGTVGDVLPDDTEGVVWAFDAETDEWKTVDPDDDIEPLDAMVVITNEDEVAQINFEGPAGEVDTPSPGEAQLDEGWNFIAPSQQADVSEVFDGSADPSSFLDVYDDADSPMTLEEDIDRSAFSLPGVTVENATVNPFSGYFVYANEDGTIPSYVYDGVTQSDANDLLNIDTETIEGTVVAENSGEELETATVALDQTSLGTFTNAAGEYAIEEVPTGTEQTVGAEAAGYQPATATADAGDDGVEITLLENNYFTHNSSDTPDAVGQGEELTVTTEIDNDGAETGEAEVQLRIGENVTDDEGDILQDNETFIVDIAEEEIDSNGTATVELTEEIRSFHPTGVQDVAIVTGDETHDAGTIEIEEEPADFQVSNLETEPTEVESGDAVTTNATVTNVGEQSSEKDVELRSGGEEVQNKTVDLVGGADQEVEFTFDAPDEAGEHSHSVWTEDDEASGTVTVLEPANFTVSDLNLEDDSITAGNTTNVSATVENTGELDAEKNVELQIDSETDSTESNVELNASENTTVEFTDVGSDTAGEVEVGISTEDDEASSTLSVEAGDPATVAAETDGTVTADGSDEVTFTVTVTDANDNLVEDATVDVDEGTDVDALGGLSAGDSNTTDANGVTTFTANSTDAGEFDVQFNESTSGESDTASATFEAGDASSVSVSTEDGTAAADGTESIDYTVSVTDANGNAVEDVSVNVNATDGDSITLDTNGSETTVTTGTDGEATVSATSETPQESATVSFTEQQSDATHSDTATATFETGDPQSVDVSTTSDTATADGSDEVQYDVTVLDGGDNPVADVNVEASDEDSSITYTGAGDNQSTDASGQVPFNATSMDAQDVTFTFTEQVNGNDVTAEGTFEAGDASSVAAETDGNATADGSDEVTFTATVTDANDNLVEGAAVDVADAADVGALGGLSAGDSNTTDANGVATFTANSTDANEFDVQFNESTSGDTATATATFEAGSASQMTASNANAQSDEDGEVAVTVEDGNGNVVEGVSVIVANNTNNLNGTSVDDTADTNASGVATFGFNETETGDYQIEFGLDNGSSVADTATVTIE